MARSATKFVVHVLLLFALAVPAHAQGLPRGLKFDSSWRAGFLFGSQTLKFKDKPEAGSDGYKVDFGPKVALLSGMIEVTPIPRASGRVVGAVTVFEGGSSFFQQPADRAPGSTTRDVWDVVSDFGSWEAAGLFHMWAGPAYRFSFVAGYRNEIWKHVGEAFNRQSEDQDLLRISENHSLSSEFSLRKLAGLTNYIETNRGKFKWI